MHARKLPRSSASFDWHATGLGNPISWPPTLRLACDLVLNAPTPMLLVWGAQQVVVFNDAYAEYAGLEPWRVPGGAAIPALPAPLAAGADALRRAWNGEASLAADAALAFDREGDAAQVRADLHFTPVPGTDGGVAGVVCTLAPVQAGAAAPGAEPPGTALRILVVEDNVDSQYLVCEMLKAFGHEADGVAHPDDAIRRLASQPYDVLFTDVSLPGMSGVDLARQALRDYGHLKVIFASGYGDTLLRHLEFPYLSLQKPYELDQLQEALAKVAQAGRAAS